MRWRAGGGTVAGRVKVGVGARRWRRRDGLAAVIGPGVRGGSGSGTPADCSGVWGSVAAPNTFAGAVGARAL